MFHILNFFDIGCAMTEQRTVAGMAGEAVIYTEKLLVIFALRSEEGGYKYPQADYAIHREGKPLSEDPVNWISTPSVPVVAEDLLRRAFERAVPDEIENLSQLAERVVFNLEKLVGLPAHQGHVTSLSSAQELARSSLPVIKDLAGLSEPANV